MFLRVTVSAINSAVTLTTTLKELSAMAKAIISSIALLFLSLSNAYAEETQNKPILVVSNDTTVESTLPSLGDEPKEEKQENTSFLRKTVVAVGIVAATYYIIKETNDDSDGVGLPRDPNFDPWK